MEDEIVTPHRQRKQYGFFCGGAPRSERTSMIRAGACTVRYSVRLEFDTKHSPIYEVHADIYPSNSPERIGYIHGYVITTHAADFDLLRLFDTCDATSQTLCDFAQQLIDADFDLYEHCAGEAIFYFELLELLPNWQGRGLGLMAYRALERRLRKRFGVQVTVFRPHPLQFESPFPAESCDAETLQAFERALTTLLEYYQVALGAKKLSDSSSYYYAYPQ
jgi:GNAT superfamily N-acetyltransferase